MIRPIGNKIESQTSDNNNNNINECVRSKYKTQLAN